MWWCKALTGLLIVTLVAACGFRPVNTLATATSVGGAEVRDVLAQVQVAAIADREGQILRNNLISQLSPRGEPARPQYLLQVNVEKSQQTISVEETSFATRANLRVSATFTLFDVATGLAIHRNDTLAVSSFNILVGEFATDAQERNAESRALIQLSEGIRSQLTAFFAQYDPANKRASKL